MLVGVLLLSIAACWASDTNTATQTFKLGVNEVAKIKVYPAEVDMTIDMMSGDLAGTSPSTQSFNQAYVQYTSIVPAKTLVPFVLETRKVQAQISDGTLPAGTLLLVRADTIRTNKGYAGVQATGGDANHNQLLGDATTTTYAARDLITGITNCYTGTGNTAGPNIVYTYGVSDWDKIHSMTDPATLTVKFTLMDAQ
jgi:hypothetical protein